MHSSSPLVTGKGAQRALGAMLILATVCALRAGTKTRPRKESIVQANGLELTFALTRSRIKNIEEFEARATFTNKSDHAIRLNALFLDVPPLLLDVRTVAGEQVFASPPPFPPEDDGEVGRVNLLPGQSSSYVYPGILYFSRPLSPGMYQVRFRYENTVAQGKDWLGKLVSDWLNFEVYR